MSIPEAPYGRVKFLSINTTPHSNFFQKPPPSTSRISSENSNLILGGFEFFLCGGKKLGIKSRYCICHFNFNKSINNFAFIVKTPTEKKLKKVTKYQSFLFNQSGVKSFQTVSSLSAYEHLYFGLELFESDLLSQILFYLLNPLQ